MKTILSGSMFFLLVLVGAPESAQARGQALGTYDTFKGKQLDPDKWVPSSFFGFGGILDARREVSGGKAQLSLRSYAGTDSNDGRGDARSRLEFPETVGALLTDIQTRVQIKKAEIRDCPTNPSASRLLVPRVAGFWFNDGTCGSPPCFQPNGNLDFTGDMWAGIDIRRDVPTADPRGVVTVVAQLFHCNLDPDCNDGDTLVFEEIGKLRVPKSGVRNAKIRIQWDEAGDRFLFQLNHDPEVKVPYDPDLNMGPPGGGFFKHVEVGANVQKCANPPKRPTAHGDIRILDVKVNDEALP